jgi:hypothetical protein
VVLRIWKYRKNRENPLEINGLNTRILEVLPAYFDTGKKTWKRSSGRKKKMGANPIGGSHFFRFSD